MARSSRPVPPPFEGRDQLITGSITAGWAIALIVVLVLHAQIPAGPLLVPLVEEGWLDTPVTEQVARIYAIEALRNASANVDVLVLGCTHYPLLHPLLRRVVPRRIQIVDSAEATARALVKLLDVQLLDVQLLDVQLLDVPL